MWRKKMFKKGFLCVFFVCWQASAAPGAAWTLGELLLSAGLLSNEWAWQNIFRTEGERGRETQAGGGLARGRDGKDGLLSKTQQTLLHGARRRETRRRQILVNSHGMDFVLDRAQARYGPAGAKVSPTQAGIKWVGNGESVWELTSIERGVGSGEAVAWLALGSSRQPSGRYLFARRKEGVS